MFAESDLAPSLTKNSVGSRFSPVRCKVSPSLHAIHESPRRTIPSISNLTESIDSGMQPSSTAGTIGSVVSPMPRRNTCAPGLFSRKALVRRAISGKAPVAYVVFVYSSHKKLKIFKMNAYRNWQLGMAFIYSPDCKRRP